ARPTWDRCRDIVVRQAPVTKLRLDGATQGFGDRLLHRIAQLARSDLCLTHQHVGVVAKLAGLFHEPSCGLACLSYPPSQDFRRQRASVEMIANTFDQVYLAARAAGSLVVFERVRVEFEQPTALATCRASYRMRPTMPIQQRPLLVSQITGSAAVNVGDARAIGLDDIVGRQDPKA